MSSSVTDLAALAAELDHLWRKEQRYLYALCLRYMGSVEEAEDALSRAALKVVELPPEDWHAILNYRAWLTRLVQNLCLDFLREQDSYRRVLARSAGTEAASTYSARTPEQENIGRELLSEIRRAIDTLPPRLRQPCRLRFLEEMAYEDIAAQLQISNDTVRKRIQLARALLQEKLGDHICRSARAW
ncbi:RNA polymerase sigma factor [Sorangium sp. So ce118]